MPDTKHQIEVVVKGEGATIQNSPVENVGDDSSSPASLKTALNIGMPSLKGVAGVGVALKVGHEAMRWIQFPFANAGALTGDYVLQNDYNNLKKAISMPFRILTDPTGFIQSEILRKNEIFKANLKVQELREISNTSAEQILRRNGRGI